MLNLSKAVAGVNFCLLQLLLVTGTTGVARGADPVLGTWVLDTQHSKYSPGPAPRSETRTYTESARGIVVKVTTVDAKGKTETREYPTNFDGKDYVQPGFSPGDTISLTRTSEYHASAVLKHADKVMANVERFISEDGETMTITFKGSGANGDEVNNISIYNRVQTTTER